MGESPCCIDRPKSCTNKSVLGHAGGFHADKMWNFDPTLTYHPVPNLNHDEKLEARQKSLLLFEKCLFVSTTLSAAMFAAWLLWMPLVHILIPDMQRDTENKITTVSHTFKRYNVVVTVYLIIPITMFFLFRIFRVFVNQKLRDEEKKGFFLALIVCQISLFMVFRYDHLQGAVHYLFTFLTISILYVYHLMVKDIYVCSFYNFHVKKTILTISVIAILGFGSLFVFVDDIEHKSGWWILACVCEVLGLVTLGLLDVVDLFCLGYDLDKNTNQK